MKIPIILKNIINFLDKNRAKAIIVGGAIRDYLLQREIKDYDIEVYNISTLDELEKLLNPFGKVNQVGKAFGVIKLNIKSCEFDFSLPRIDKKIEKGHKGFSIKIDSSLNFKEAASRRDFTINAMGFDIISNRLLDPFGGRNDLKKGILRYVNKNSFIEDPLRVYRAIQFCARFNLKLEENTFNLCKNMIENNLLDELPKERIYTEWKKFLLKSNNPSIAFRIMDKLGIIQKYFPELNNIIKSPKSLQALDEMAKLLQKELLNKKSKLKLLFATICHNLDEKNTKKFLLKLTNEKKFIDSIIPLVKYYSKVFNNIDEKDIMYLSTKVNIKDLALVSEAIFLANNSNKEFIAKKWLINKAKELNVLNTPPKHFLKGKDLIDIGLKPSTEFKTILNKVYEKQLNMEIKDKKEALEYVKSIIN